MDWQLRIVTLYLFVCKVYREELEGTCLRLSNNDAPHFTDEEVITLYVFGIMEKRTRLKEVYQHANNHLRNWFPKLPGYETFVRRINRLGDTMTHMADLIRDQIPPHFQEEELHLVDSMPIVLAQEGRRFKAKVAPEIASPNGYCASKKMYYYGIKMHVIGKKKTSALPTPEIMSITDAGTHDLTALRQMMMDYGSDRIIFADKAYQVENKEYLPIGQGAVYTPVKKTKGQEILEAADHLFSTAVSRIRQPIESLFSWIEEKTKIQFASKVRSTAGLLVHVFGKLSAALLMLLDKYHPTHLTKLANGQ